MTAAYTAGAVSHRTISWHAIDWWKAHENVRRLQARIVKATQEGRWGKVKALQHLLTHSFSGKALCFCQSKNRPLYTRKTDHLDKPHIKNIIEKPANLYSKNRPLRGKRLL